MTVINAMRFNKGEYGMVVDSQSSTHLRKYSIADKVKAISTQNGTSALVGGTGSSDLLYETLLALNRAASSKELSVDQLAKALSQISIGIKRDKIDSYLKSTFGIEHKQALSGEGINPQLMQNVVEALTGQNRSFQEFFNGSFLLIGKDSEDVALYGVPFGGPELLSARPYGSIGSGSDESDKVLYGYVNSLKREQQNDIPFLDGMAALIRATNASSDINQGVGGVPTIGYYNSKGITLLREAESKLVTEIVKIREMIQKPDYELSLSGLLNDSMPLDEAERIAFNKDNPVKYDQIMRCLRGFK